MSRPLPQPQDEYSAEFWDRCAREELCFQRCTACGRWRHLPRAMCAACGSAEWEWAQSSGRGRLFSWIVTHQPLLPPFADQVPYAVIIVELEEGVRMVSGVRDLPLEELTLDLPLEVVFEHFGDVALPFFRRRRDTHPR
ncbi:MAG: Zn-ribbon domain-containing OB-fold protein [Myxococcota bacterium]